MNTQYTLEVNEACVHLGSHAIVRNASFALPPGTITALQGSNGCGKSTLIKAIAGIYPLTSGTILAYDQPIDNQRNLIAYVPQHVIGDAPMSATASEVVATGLLGKRQLTFPHSKKKRVHEALSSVGLAHRANEAIQTFSGGQQQRVLIARALVRDPKILLLDEPLSGSDREFHETFADLLKDLASGGRSVLIALHERGILEPLITQTIHLEDGIITSITSNDMAVYNSESDSGETRS